MNSSYQRLLWVEPNAEPARAAAAYLRARGWKVDTARNISEALAAPRPAVLVCASELEDGSAYQLLAAWENGSSLPYTVMLESESANQTDLGRAMRAGVREVLSSSPSRQALIACLERSGGQRTTGSFSNQPSPFAETYDTHPLSVRRAIRRLLAFALRAGFGQAVRARIGTACAEIFENAWEHAYSTDRGAIHVQAEFADGELVISIRDEGQGFDSERTLYRAQEDYELSGLSRAISLCEDLNVQSNATTGTCVQLHFSARLVNFDDNEVGADLSDLDYLAPEHSRQIVNDLGRHGEDPEFQLSPALAVCVGRLLSGPLPKRLPAFESSSPLSED